MKSRALGPLIAFVTTTDWRNFQWRTSRKFWLALLNTLLLIAADNAGAFGIDLGDADGWVQGALAVLTPIVVWAVRNDPQPPAAPSGAAKE